MEMYAQFCHLNALSISFRPKETVAEIVEGMKLPYDDHDQGLNVIFPLTIT